MMIIFFMLSLVSLSVSPPPPESSPGIVGWRVSSGYYTKVCGGQRMGVSIEKKQYIAEMEVCCLSLEKLGNETLGKCIIELPKTLNKDSTAVLMKLAKKGMVVSNEYSDCSYAVKACKASIRGQPTPSNPVDEDSHVPITNTSSYIKGLMLPDKFFQADKNIMYNLNDNEKFAFDIQDCIGANEEEYTTELMHVEGEDVCMMDCKTGFTFFARNITNGHDYAPNCFDETHDDWFSFGEEGVFKNYIDNAEHKYYGSKTTIKKCYFLEEFPKNESTTVMALTYGEMKYSVLFKKVCTDFHIADKCIVDYRASYTDVLVEMKSEYTTYSIIGSDGFKSEGFFEGSKTVHIPFKEPGIKTYHGRCGNIRYSRKIAITTDEYCDEMYQGMSEVHQRFYCKNKGFVKNVVFLYFIFLVLYYACDYIAAILSGIMSLIMMLIVMVTGKKLMCPRCKNARIPGFHKCQDLKCMYCGETVDTRLVGEDIEKESKQTRNEMALRAHYMNRCQSYNSDSDHVIIMTNWFKLFYCILKNIFMLIPKMGILVTLMIILIVMIPEVTADGLIEEMTENVQKEVNQGLKKRHEDLNRCVIYEIAIGLPLIAIMLISTIVSGKLIRIYMERKIKGTNTVCEFCFEDKGKQHKCNRVECAHCGTRMAQVPDMSLKGQLHIFRSAHGTNCDATYNIGISAAKIRTQRRNKTYIRSIIGGLPIVVVVMLLSFFSCVLTVGATHQSTMELIEADMGSIINELLHAGFHPYNARFSDTAREKITAIREFKDCGKGICKLRMEAETELVIRDGRESGFEVCSKESTKGLQKDGCSFMNIKVSDPVIECTYTLAYSTGQIFHQSESSDTCTQYCNDCQAQMYATKENKQADVYGFNHEGTSGWGCNAANCLSINRGCTCGRCWCNTTEEFRVLNLVTEKSMFNLCLQIGGEGYCNAMTRETRAGKLFVLKYGEESKQCPDRLACRDEVCFKGEINNLGEYDNKFGSAQKIRGFTTTKKEEEKVEDCAFAKHRRVTYTKCCKDTYHMKDMLTVVPGYMDSNDVMEIKVNDLGSWKINIEVPALIYTEKADVISITDLKISGCKGCWGCNEGGSCLLSYRSNFDSTIIFECAGCRTDMDHVQVRKGSKSTSFNVFCPVQNTNLTCKVNETEVSTMVSLLEPPKTPHGDGAINVDKTRFIEKDCGALICGLGEVSWFSGWMGALKIIGIIIAIVVFIVVAFYAVRLFRMVMGSKRPETKLNIEIPKIDSFKDYMPWNNKNMTLRKDGSYESADKVDDIESSIPWMKNIRKKTVARNNMIK